MHRLRKPNKYGAVKATVDNIKFDSKKEADRYLELKLLQRCKKISELKLQTRFDFIIDGLLVCYYKADFEYIENGKRVIEDSKGVRTAVYIIKKKLMKAVHNIDIFET